MSEVKEARQEQIWTGRYGEAREEVLAKGQDFVVINYNADMGKIHGANPDLKDGVYVFSMDTCPVEDDKGNLGEFMHGWTDQVIMRAYNAEDAARNWWGAISQWHVWTNYPDLDWETEPFTDEDGNFPEDGGDHGGCGYDAAPPDETAKDGITRPDLFTEQGGFLPEKVELERSPMSPTPGVN